MTVEEVEMVFDEMKAEGRTEDEIAGAMYMMYSKGKLTLDELRDLVGILGYEFTAEFEALPEEEKKKPKNAFKDVEETEEDDEADAKLTQRKGDKKKAELTRKIVKFMADINPDEMFYPNYPSEKGYDRHFEFVEDYCKQYGINKKRALKEYDSKKRQKVAAQYTLSKLDVYRFTVLLGLNKTEFVQFMTICGYMPDPNSKLDLFFMDYMDGKYMNNLIDMYGNDFDGSVTICDMDRLFGFQDGIQFTISGTESAAQAIRYCAKK